MDLDTGIQGGSSPGAIGSEGDHRVDPGRAFVPFRITDTEQSIPARFEQQVRRHPHRVAVKTRQHELLYESLNTAANRVARALLKRDSAREGSRAEPVALLLEHDAPLIVALLGVLKAGKIYVPLDPSYPRARLLSMLEDSTADVILTSSRMHSMADELAGSTRQVLTMEEIDAGAGAALPPGESGPSIPPDAFAYILYTSGSTGQPKGVVESHRNVLHFVMNYVNRGQIGPEDRVTLLVSCSFSMSASCIYTALLNGAALHMLDVRQAGAAHLADWLAEHEITVFFGGSLFRHLAGTLTGRESFPRLRLIYFGGEPLYKSDVELYKRYFPDDCLLVNNFGASEMKAFRQYFISKETRVSGAMAPIGYALADTEVLLLDESGRPVGPGEAGEIAVKTRYLAPGYWRRPELTAAAFRPAPGGRGERMYCTGDRGRMLPDGCLLHLGRTGSRVKIRGYLVDLAEIEAALLELDGIREAVVLPREIRSVREPAAPEARPKGCADDRAEGAARGPGDARLVAYLVPSSRPAPPVERLRRALSERLPAYMLPSSYVVSKTLPRNPNGKVDRQALPAPGRGRPDNEPYVAPRTPLEAAVAEIWAEVLGLDRVGVNDPFLDLGGDSLLAAQVIARVRALFPVELSLRRLFEARTVAGMALTVAQSQAGKLAPSAADALLTRMEELSEAEVHALLGREPDPP